MNLEVDKCILSLGDIITIRLIMKYIAEKDSKKLAALPNVKLVQDNHFWSSLDDCGTEFEEPPKNFFVLWHMQFGEEKQILSLEGPMWSRNQGDSDWYLYLEKYIDAEPPYIYIKGYGST
jgi:hypothetical protein